MQGLELGEGISVALSWLSTQHSSVLPHCCSGIRPWVGVGDLCSPASPLHIFPLQFGVRHPAVLRTLPSEKVQMGTLPARVAPVWAGGAWAPYALGLPRDSLASSSSQGLEPGHTHLCAHTAVQTQGSVLGHGDSIPMGCSR